MAGRVPAGRLVERLSPSTLVANLTDAIAALQLALGGEKANRLIRQIVGDLGADEDSAPEGGETPPEARPA